MKHLLVIATTLIALVSVSPAAGAPPHFKNRALLEKTMATTFHVSQAACLKTSSRSYMCLLADGTVIRVVCKTATGTGCIYRRTP